MSTLTKDIQITNYVVGQESVLTDEAIAFLEFLHKKFEQSRQNLLLARQKRQVEIQNGEKPNFLVSTKTIRESAWEVAPIPADLQNRQIELTGTVDRKMVVNALNSGAKVFMADFEDATSPTWANLIEGQQNLLLANLRKIDFEQNGKKYALKENVAVLKVRPRGWHLTEKHFQVNEQAMSASLFDFGLYFFHNHKILLEKETAPYFYLPKLENHLEARLWNDVFVATQDYFNVPQNTIKVTVLIETILAAFEMEEIVYELRNHLAGLNAGRWDYIFSAIKKFSFDKNAIFPDRTAVTMAVPFMTAYAKQIVRICHKRKAHAIGGMAAFIPSRKDAEINEKAFSKVRADKEREVMIGFDGSWVAHPDLVPIGMEAFLKVLGENPHQKHKMPEGELQASELIDFQILDNSTNSGIPAKITEQGIRTNIRAGILYMESWLRGVGAAAIDNLMEDAATAEISRAQLWQWLKYQAVTDQNITIDLAYYEKLKQEELAKILKEFGDNYRQMKTEEATELFDNLVKNEEFAEFLTLKAYKYL